ncbi:MAG TPA: lamin tail domain-containing protein, partial [Chitinophagaceae bacterium]|nr:lamin tail domain-containing protein [Chitinophagaceae bacterium]
MRKKNSYTFKAIVLFFTFFCASQSFAQVQKGHVVINEYMPWTLNGCGATAEFIELLNFGPGPIDIGCYILTDGDYSITIPPNTILQPGEFYVLAGQSFIPTPCANIDSNITVDLNWTTCGCTSGPIPTTGDGFFTDGGSASEQLVLLDPNLKIVDAVTRDLPTEPSALITTSSVGGACAPKVFDLDDMIIDYEILGMSAGRGNSFARKLDGDCGWVKDPQQSGHATNNTPNEESDVSYELTLLTPMSCNMDGAIAINVVGGNVNDIFPMNYTLVYDQNNNGLIDFSDQYLSGIDSTPRIIYVTNLGAGTYRITVSSLQGCNLKTFNFTILPCLPLLPVKLIYFKTLNS